MRFKRIAAQLALVGTLAGGGLAFSEGSTFAASAPVVVTVDQSRTSTIAPDLVAAAVGLNATPAVQPVATGNRSSFLAASWWCRTKAGVITAAVFSLGAWVLSTFYAGGLVISGVWLGPGIVSQLVSGLRVGAAIYTLVVALVC